MIFFFQYDLNFVVYAASNKQYRMAYKLYLKKQMSFLFRICKTKERSSIFFINTASSPELDTNKGKNKEDIHVRVGRSLDVEMEKVMISYIGKVTAQN